MWFLNTALTDAAEEKLKKIKNKLEREKGLKNISEVLEHIINEYKLE